MENKAHLEMIHSSEVLFIVKFVTWEAYAALSYADFMGFHGISWSFMGQYTLVYSNVAMKNPPLMDDCPTKTTIYPAFATLDTGTT